MALTYPYLANWRLPLGRAFGEQRSMGSLPLPAEFYARSALIVARDLLGARLVRVMPDGTRISGRIVETEAYSGVNDLASHGRTKRTKRNTPMWGQPGYAYTYLTYGLYW